MKKLNDQLEKLMEVFGIHIQREQDDNELTIEEIEKAQMYVTNFLDTSKPGDKLTIENK